MDIGLNDLLKIVKEVSSGSRSDYRRRVLDLEDFLLTLPQLEIPHISRVHGGMYCREMTVPKGAIVTGQIYKFDHFEVMVSGDITVPMENGEIKRLKGYNCLESLAGKKRVVYAHEDTIWMTFHPFSGKDGEEIQKFITADTFEDLEFFHRTVNQGDYKTFVKRSGLTEKEIRKIAEESSDMIDLPAEYDHLYISDSDIEGLGFYSKISINKGDVICPSRIGDKRTQAGRYVNHAMLPNAKMILQDNEWLLVAMRDIEASEEITTNYNDTFNTRQMEGDL